MTVNMIVNLTNNEDSPEADVTAVRTRTVPRALYESQKTITRTGTLTIVALSTIIIWSFVLIAALIALYHGEPYDPHSTDIASHNRITQFRPTRPRTISSSKLVDHQQATECSLTSRYECSYSPSWDIQQGLHERGLIKVRDRLAIITRPGTYFFYMTIQPATRRPPSCTYQLIDEYASMIDRIVLSCVWTSQANQSSVTAPCSTARAVTVRRSLGLHVRILREGPIQNACEPSSQGSYWGILA